MAAGPSLRVPRDALADVANPVARDFECRHAGFEHRSKHRHVHQFTDDLGLVAGFLKGLSDFRKVFNEQVEGGEVLDPHRIKFSFKPGYENRRVNVTMLYGTRAG